MAQKREIDLKKAEQISILFAVKSNLTTFHKK